MSFVTNQGGRTDETFLNSLLQHLIYTSEQGLKIQISEIFKYLFDNELTLTQQYTRDILYRQLIVPMVDFLEKFAEKYSVF